MRPNNNQQQNKNRSRGRNNNGGRKHVNPLSRNYESNGPDVKVRGNAAHVAEKYLQLARDAQASGDSVMAENYLQHAEHYFRIMSAAQPQGGQRQDQFGQAIEDEDFDDDFPPVNDRFSMPERHQPAFQTPQQPEAAPQQQLQPQAGDQQQRRQPEQQRSPAVVPPMPVAADEEAVVPPSIGEAPAVVPEGEVGADGEPRRHRERRPRRRSRAAVGDAGVDPSMAPQPDVGELPAFITAVSSVSE